MSAKNGATRDGKITPEYSAWRAMKTRCYNPNTNRFHLYGGRGIKVCNEWLNDFPQFLRDVGPKPSVTHSLDRINVNGNYTPDNVRWATKQEQANNRRSRYLTVDEYERLTAKLKKYQELYGDIDI